MASLWLSIVPPSTAAIKSKNEIVLEIKFHWTELVNTLYKTVMILINGFLTNSTKKEVSTVNGYGEDDYGILNNGIRFYIYSISIKL